MSKKIDNVALLNRLTHLDDGSVDKKLFETFLRQIGVFNIFKKILEKLKIENVYKSTLNENGFIEFNIVFKTKKDVTKALEVLEKKINKEEKFMRRTYTISYFHKGGKNILIEIQPIEIGDEEEDAN